MLVVAKPWKMTKRNFYSSVGSLPDNWETKGWKIHPTGTKTKIIRTPNKLFHLRGQTLYRPYHPLYHRECVIRALEKGERVPKRVLRDYPGMVVGRKTHTHVFCGERFWSYAALQKHLRKPCSPSAQTRMFADAKERILKNKE